MPRRKRSKIRYVDELPGLKMVSFDKEGRIKGLIGICKAKDLKRKWWIL